MNPRPSALRRFAAAKEGVTAVEYALIGAFVSVLLVSGARAVGIEVRDVLLRLADAF